MEFAIQLIIILICLFYGARKGGIALGLLGGIGLVSLGDSAGVRRVRRDAADCREAAAA